MDRAKLFTEQLTVIDRLIAWRSRKYGLSADELEDFSQEVKLRLIENDYALLGKFKGRCSVKTFLNVVISNQAKDFLIAKNGKRRPTAAARRLGPEAIELEALLRDGFTFPEAARHLRENRGVASSESELYDLARQLKLRPRRKIEGEEQLARLEDPLAPGDPAIDRERDETARRVESVLAAAIRDLPDVEDRLILRLRFFEGVSVVQIARTFGLDERPLYRRLETLCKRQLRQALEDAGLSATEVLELFDSRKKIEVEP